MFIVTHTAAILRDYFQHNLFAPLDFGISFSVCECLFRVHLCDSALGVETFCRQSFVHRFLDVASWLWH